MMKDGRIGAIVDWEFVGPYPSSQLLSGVGVVVHEMEPEEGVEKPTGGVI